MESLVANYASSDDDEQALPTVAGSKLGQSKSSFPNPSPLLSSLPQPKLSTPSSSSSSSSLFQTLPQPKQTAQLPKPLFGIEGGKSDAITAHSSLFSSLPQPRQTPSNSSIQTSNSVVHRVDREDSKSSSKLSSSTSLFLSLPQPISKHQQPPVASSSSSGQKAKRLVQLAPLLNPNSAKRSQVDSDNDDEDEESETKTPKGSEFTGQPPSVTSFLSTLPAARNTATLGVHASSGSGRRAIIETDTAAPDTGDNAVANNAIVDQDPGNYASYDGNAYGQSDIEQNVGNYNVNYDGLGNYYQPNLNLDAGVQAQTGVAESDISFYGNYDTDGSQISYADYGQYGNNWADGSGVGMQEQSGMSENALKLKGKRGRSQVPEEIIEVKQDELMKNRPREDQTKLTGIAFGPSYKPVSTKGKPSKLHKRKHQIGSLYFEMKQKEMELSERRARGMLTKAETQAKYGW